MNELVLGDQIKTHVVITYTGGHYLITGQENDLLKTVGKNDVFRTGENRIMGGNIAEVITIEEYYKQFPEKQEQNYQQPPSFEPEQLDHKAITDECIAKVKRSSTEALIRGVKLLEESIRKRKGGTYKEHQMAWACNQELKSRSIFPYFVPEG